jgi:hypothetical protein
MNLNWLRSINHIKKIIDGEKNYKNEITDNDKNFSIKMNCLMHWNISIIRSWENDVLKIV